MIPIIYGPQEKNFTSNGLGRLTDCVEFTVTEERNGRYEAEFKYPIDGVHFDDLVEGNIVSCTHDEQGDRQPFKIYQHTAPDLNGVVTFFAHHISYDLANVILRPFSATSAASALAKFETEAMTEQPFSFWTDKASGGSFEITVPSPAKAMLGGVQGSILDAFGGGEYEWDNYLVKLYQNRGNDSGVTIRYGKNLMALQHTYDTLGLYNAVIPYWVGQDEEVVYGGIVTGSGGIGQSSYWTDEDLVRITNENGVDFTFDFTISQTTTMDLSQEFDEMPTAEQLEDRALAIMESNEPWAPKENIKVDFVALWQTEEYANIAPLERVRLCDTVTVYYPALNVNATAKVITTKYDVLTDRYSSIELGAEKTSFAQVLTAETEEKLAEVPSKSMMQEAIDHATALITGGLGGHVVFRYDADGKPTEILVMDTEDEATAVHVLRINVNGIGFSYTGVSGQYSTAWTLDGSFVADFITAGSLSANLIRGGTLTLGGVNNSNGTLEVYDANNLVVGRWDINGLFMMGRLGRYLMQANVGIVKTIKGTNTYGEPVYGNTLGFTSKIFKDDVLTGIRTQGCNDASSGFDIIDSVISSRGFGFVSLMTDGDISSETVPTTYQCVTAQTMKKTGGAPVLHTQFRDKTGSSAVVCVFEVGGGGVEYNSDWAIWGPSVTYHDDAPRVSITSDKVRVRGGGGEVDFTGKYFQYYGDNDTSGAYAVANNTSGTVAIDTGNRSSGRSRFYAGNGTVEIETNTSTANQRGRLSYSYTNGYWNINGKNRSGYIAVDGSSSKRYKHDIADLTAEELDPHRLYGLTAKQFVFNEDHPLQYGDMAGQTLPGFIAEDVAEVYPAAVIHKDGEVENWDERRIIPGMLQLIQEQKQEIDELKERLARLEHVVEALTNDMR